MQLSKLFIYNVSLSNFDHFTISFFFFNYLHFVIHKKIHYIFSTFLIIAIIYTSINNQSNNNDKKKKEADNKPKEFLLDRRMVQGEKFSKFPILINFLSTARENERSTRKLSFRRVCFVEGKNSYGSEKKKETFPLPIWCVWYTRARNTIPESGSNVLPRGARAIILQYPLRSHRNVERIKMRQKR